MIATKDKKGRSCEGQNQKAEKEENWLCEKCGEEYMFKLSLRQGQSFCCNTEKSSDK